MKQRKIDIIPENIERQTVIHNHNKRLEKHSTQMRRIYKIEEKIHNNQKHMKITEQGTK